MLLGPVAIFLILVSSQTLWTVHLRYILPIFPFLFVWTSHVARSFCLGHRTIALSAAFSMLWVAASSLSAYPHSLSYFNELVGGPSHGHEHLNNSNCDWGQDLLYLKEWLEAHPEAKMPGLAYYGAVDPSLAGIEYLPAPPNPAPTNWNPEISKEGPMPGWYVVSTNYLHGHRFTMPAGNGQWIYLDKPSYCYFLDFAPVARIGYSLFVYHLGRTEANLARRRLALPEIEEE